MVNRSGFRFFPLILSLVFLSHLFVLERCRNRFLEYDLHFFAFFCLLLSICLLIKHSLGVTDKNKWGVDVLSVLFILLVLYVTSLVFFSKAPNLRYLYLFWLLLILFFLFRKTLNHLNTLSVFFILYALLTAIVDTSNIQFFSGLFFLKNGASINTGENANYYASILPFIFSFLFEKKKKISAKIFFGLVLVTFFACIYVLLTCHARIAVVSTILGIGLIIFKVSRFHSIFSKKVNTVYRKLLLILIITTIIFCSGKVLYNRNPSSVQGRFLIYEVSLQMIKSNPFFGHGLESFKGKYNIYQSDYIRTHNLSLSKKQLAGDNYFAFNELIDVFIEFGVVGLIIVILIIYVLISSLKSNQKSHYQNMSIGVFGSLLSILVSAFFSYPLHTFSILINLVFFTAIISGGLESKFSINLGKTKVIFVYVIVLFLVFVFSVEEYKRIIALNNWERAAHIALVGNFNDASVFYAKANEELFNDGNFLYNFGAESYKAGFQQQSLLLLKKASLFTSNSNLYVYLGNNYEAIKDFKNAEFCYNTAEFIYPSKFLPKFQLLLLYQDFGLKKQAIYKAKEIEKYPVKIPSVIIDNYKKYSRDFLRSNNEH